MLAITGASGQLGGLVIAELLRRVKPGEILATARDVSKLADIAAKGVEVRALDYDRPDTHGAALKGVSRLLLVSGTEIGKRLGQHKAVIAAAKEAGVGLIAYTSILRAPVSPLLPAEDHRATEAMLRESGVPHVFLRNGWYLENYLGLIAGALESGAITGSAGEGRISAALRADYAAAAAAALASREDIAGRAFELAADESFTMGEFAAELARQSGKPVAYHHLSPADHRARLEAAGLPEGLIFFLVATDTHTAQGALFDDSRDLSRLIGRPTISWRAALVEALKGRG